MRYFAISIIIVTAVVLGCPATSADDDQNKAQRAVERGEIHPLDQVLDVARRQIPGEVVKIELEHEHGRWIYEIKILSAEGVRREVEIDGSSLRVLELD